MKKLIIIICMTIFVGCKKEDTTPDRQAIVTPIVKGQVVFYLPNNSIDTQVDIYIDGVFAVKLTKRLYSANCGDLNSYCLEGIGNITYNTRYVFYPSLRQVYGQVYSYNNFINKIAVI